MSIVAEFVTRRLWAGLTEEIERQTREDDARGPEPEAAVVTRTVLPVGPGWTDEKSAPLPLSLPDGYIVAGPVVGPDEIRAQRMVIAAQAEFGWGRSA
ncbi:hypothetical protein [Streptomyces parvus]|uniref:hypothetical protein n=1 Tax=Streptomyces parvus TaxID=66428 RepID=UPI0021017F16|nr:hypothetical protein [Streptomyces parvus]MCQ1582593.1 hypothetical protein [Streptomyces parvus]